MPHALFWQNAGVFQARCVAVFTDREEKDTITGLRSVH